MSKQLWRSSEAALPGLIRNLLGIHAVHTEELPDDIQHTKERKPDVLKKVTDKFGDTFGAPTMTDHIRSEPMNFKYRLIALSAVDYHLLLRSDNPEEKMLAILADFGGSDPERVIEKIVSQVIATSKGDFSKQRHIRQLRILAQLRNLAPESLQIMDSITNYISEENDILYRRGEKKGMEKGKETFIKNLLLNTDFTIAKIAGLTNVTEAFVKKVKKTVQ